MVEGNLGTFMVKSVLGILQAKWGEADLENQKIPPIIPTAKQDFL